jgi:hypothetical protein
MAAGVNLLQLFDGDFGVNGGGVQLLVSEQLLDETDVGPVFQHVRGAGVAQDMAAPFPFQPGLAQPGGHHAAENVGIESAAIAGQEKGLRARVQAEARADFPQVTLDPLQGPQAHGDNAVFPAFAKDAQRAPLGVEVGLLQLAKLGSAQPARVKEFQHGPVAHAQRVGHVRDDQQAVQFAGRERLLGQAFLHAGQFQLAGRIVQEDVPKRLRCVLQPRRWPLGLV